MNKNFCLMGDAAHASLPSLFYCFPFTLPSFHFGVHTALGQGFGMGLEDAVALGVLLPRATDRSAIPSRLVAYERLRKERAEFVAAESFEQQHLPQKRGLYLRCMSSLIFFVQLLTISSSY